MLRLSFIVFSLFRPVARGGASHPLPNLPKGPLSVTKWAKNEVLVGGLRGVRFKKFTFWDQKVHFLGVPHLPKIDPG